LQTTNFKSKKLLTKLKKMETINNILIVKFLKYFVKNKMIQIFFVIIVVILVNKLKISN